MKDCLKKTLCFAFATLFSSVSFASCVLKVRVNDIPPQYMLVNGKWEGLAVELMNTLFDEADCDVVYQKIPWQRALLLLEKGEIDAMANVNYTKSRSKHFYFLWGMTTETTILVTHKKSNFHINSLDDLKLLPKNIVIERGNLFDNKFTSKLKSDEGFNSKFQPVSHSRITELVITGRVSGELDLLVNAKYRMKTEGKYSKLKIHPFVVSELPSFFAFSKKSVSKELLLKLQQANIKAISNGKYLEIIEKWK